MKELTQKDRVEIENELYEKVMLLIESQYNLEGIINKDKKDSTKIIFKDKKIAIRRVSEEIEQFAKDNGLYVNEVKNYLIAIIENKISFKNMYEEEYQIAKSIISIEER